MDRESVFWIFGAVWVALGVAVLIFHKRASFKTKLRWYLFVEFGLSILFAAFGTYMAQGAGLGVIALIWAFCLGFSVLNWRFVQFCPNCAATVWPAGFGRAAACPKCNTKLHAAHDA